MFKETPSETPERGITPKNDPRKRVNLRIDVSLIDALADIHAQLENHRRAVAKTADFGTIRPGGDPWTQSSVIRYILRLGVLAHSQRDDLGLPGEEKAASTDA